MNLIIDIGNTKTKIASIKNGVVTDRLTICNYTTEVVLDFLKKQKNIKCAIVASVQNKPIKLLHFLNQNLPHCFFFDANLPIPIANNYQSKSTLGYDRLAACVGAWSLYKNNNILVIDAGTAITFDIVNSLRGYIGGCISPGLAMRFKALNEFTQKLPLLSINNDFKLVGTDTKEAIIGGVQNGIIHEIDGYITKLQHQYNGLKVIITGGDSIFLSKYTSKKIEQNSDILLIGLDTIANHNLNLKCNKN